MKRHLFLALLLCFAAVPLFAARRTSNIVDDVIRMQKSGVAEDEIVAFIHKGDSRMDVSADDMIALHDAGVSRAVIKAILDESAARGERRDSYRRDDGYDGYGYGYAPSVYLYGGYPYFYSPYYYDPFWYGPRVSLGFNFGFGRYYGYRGGFRGGFHRGHR
jgi:hypothetical protein